MPGSGVLYKALATGQFTDQGDDPTDYADDFKQITGKGSQDLQPVIDLVTWVEHSSDAEFDRRLGDHVDVTAFARYAAVQNLLLNFDDMAGPGRNFYLWYDLDTRTFTVIGWDYNLTFSGNAEQGPHDATSMGGGFPGGGPPAGMELPEGMEPPAGMRPPGGGFGGNKLKERFLASAAFRQVYEDAYRELYARLYGTALATLDGITAVLASVEGHDAEAVSTDAEQLRTLIRQRISSLAGDEVVKAG